MKKLGFKLLPVAILVLGMACQPTSDESTAASEGNDAVAKFSDLKVAFVFTDSVINKYDFYKEKSEELTEKGKKFEGDLQSRARGFEREVANFQQTGGNMTPNQQRAKQEELIKKEQNLMTYRDNLMQELAADESSLYSEVYDKIQAYLKVYAKENDLDLILNSSRGGAIWYGNESLDLTKQIIEGLNKDLAAGEEKPSTTETEEAATPDEADTAAEPEKKD